MRVIVSFILNNNNEQKFNVMPVNMFSYVAGSGKITRKFPASQTAPDDTLSIRELVSRYTRGQDLLPDNVAPYTGDSEEHLELHGMDKLDLIVHARQVMGEAQEAKERLALRKDAAEKLKAREILESRIREEMLQKNAFDEKTDAL